MVGRLGIPTNKATTNFATLANDVFSDKKIIGPGVFKASKLEKALKDIVREATGNEDERMMDHRPNAGKCKTYVSKHSTIIHPTHSLSSMVFAMSKHNMNAAIPTIFRSYQAPANQTTDCAIWEALRATTAHPDMFKPIEIGEPNLREPFVASAMGCSNPIEHVLAEASLLYPHRRVACIVSIGPGHARTIRIPKLDIFQRIFPTSVIAAMRDIATDSEQVAERIAGRFKASDNVYFRLNVDQGMQDVRLGDWDRLAEVKAHTRSYMQKAETTHLINRAVKAIREKKGVVTTAQIGKTNPLGMRDMLVG
jgi:hypothetical protein